MPPYSLVDLHTHSTASDGTLSPTALCQRAAAAGIRTLALTDHDTTEGLAEAGRAAAELGIDFVTGVEISVGWNSQTLHIVGLAIDPRNRMLQEGLAGLMVFRDWRAQEIGRRLAKMGILEAHAGAMTYAKGRMVGRAHFARWLAEQGYCPDPRSAFGKYLGRGCPACVGGDWASLAEAVTWILDAGGRAVLAHPGRYRLSGARMRALLREFCDNGGSAVEVISGSQAAADTPHFVRLAREHGLAGSIGSDYHGPELAYTDMGRLPPLPTGLTPVWEDIGEAKIRGKMNTMC